MYFSLKCFLREQRLLYKRFLLSRSGGLAKLVRFCVLLLVLGSKSNGNDKLDFAEHSKLFSVGLGFDFFLLV